MSQAPKKRGFDQSDESQESKASSLACCADGCPLPGTFAPSISPKPGDWRCWAHDRLEEPSQWPFLTQGINGNLWLFRLAARIASIPMYDLERNEIAIRRYLAERGRADLQREAEPVASWVSRICNAAFAAAFEHVEQHWTGAKKIGRPVRQAIADLAHGMTA